MVIQLLCKLFWCMGDAEQLGDWAFNLRGGGVQMRVGDCVSFLAY